MKLTSSTNRRTRDVQGMHDTADNKKQLTVGEQSRHHEQKRMLPSCCNVSSSHGRQDTALLELNLCCRRNC